MQLEALSHRNAPKLTGTILNEPLERSRNQKLVVEMNEEFILNVWK